MTPNPAAVAYEAYRKYWNSQPSSASYLVSWDYQTPQVKESWWAVVRSLAKMANKIRRRAANRRGGRNVSERLLIKRLLDALLIADHDCEHLHHDKKDFHNGNERCPVEARINRVINDAQRYLDQESKGQE